MPWNLQLGNTPVWNPGESLLVRQDQWRAGFQKRHTQVLLHVKVLFHSFKWKAQLLLNSWWNVTKPPPQPPNATGLTLCILTRKIYLWLFSNVNLLSYFVVGFFLMRPLKQLLSGTANLHRYLLKASYPILVFWECWANPDSPFPLERYFWMKTSLLWLNWLWISAWEVWRAQTMLSSLLQSVSALSFVLSISTHFLDLYKATLQSKEPLSF